MKIKKKHVVLLILFGICLIVTWFSFEFFREWECQEYGSFKKANEIIQKIENYRKDCGKLPESLEEVRI